MNERDSYLGGGRRSLQSPLPEASITVSYSIGDLTRYRPGKEIRVCHLVLVHYAVYQSLFGSLRDYYEKHETPSSVDSGAMIV